MIALEIAGIVEIAPVPAFMSSTTAARPRLRRTRAGTLRDIRSPPPVRRRGLRLAAERITNEQIEELRTLLVAMEQENQQQDAHERADEQFHCLIAEAARNSAVSSTVAWLWQLRKESGLSQRFHQRVRDEGIKPVIDDHRRILNALERDPAGSRRAWRPSICSG